MDSILCGDKSQQLECYCQLSDVLLKGDDQVNSHFYFESINNKASYSYSEFIQLTYKMCQMLRSCGIQANEYIILQFSSKELFTVTFWACIISGFIPTIISVPDEWDTSNLKLDRLKLARQMLNNSYIVCDDNLYLYLTHVFPEDTCINVADYLCCTPNYAVYTVTDKYDTALIAFTSGSMGFPKAVQLSHQNLIAATIGTIQQKSFTSQDICISWMPSDHVYTVVLLNLVPTALKCTQIHIDDDRVFIDSTQCFYYLSRYKATVAWMLNFMFESFVLNQHEHYLTREIDLSNLRLIMNGGEKINWPILDKAIEILQLNKMNANVISPAWGMTETSSGVIYANYIPSFNVKENQFGICLGFPIPGVTIRVVDKNHNVLPKGEEGYLEISGLTVTKGYVANEIANKESFYNHWFLTGDIAVITDDGMHFIGRDKDDININGRSISLSEIEGRLTQIDHIVLHCIALNLVNLIELQENLVICIVLQKNEQFAVVFDLLQEELIKNFGISAYAVYQIKIEDIPRNSIGKILKKVLLNQIIDDKLDYVSALFNQSRLNMGAKLENKQLTTSTELNTLNMADFQYIDVVNQVSLIWQKILNINYIDINKSFFNLGGSSLKALELKFKINEVFHIKFNVADVFRYDSINKISDMIFNKDSSSAKNAIESEILPYTVNQVEDQVLSHAQERMWFIDRYENGTSAYNIPLLFKISSNECRLEHIEYALKAIVSRYEVLHSLIKTSITGIVYQEVINLDEMPFILENIDFDGNDLTFERFDSVVNHIFKLDQEYPIKLKIFVCNNNEKYVLMVVHHIAFDGWSLNILMRDLNFYLSYYMQQASNNEVKLMLPNLSIQYRDFAIWQRECLSDKFIEQQRNYWQNELQDYVNLNLPIDKQRPLQVSYAGDDVLFMLDTITSDNLRRLARELDVSLYSVLLSAYYICLSVYSSQDDIVIGIPIANRNHVQLENIVGIFVNNLAVRIKINSKALVINHILEINAKLIEAQLYQDLPFDKLVEVLQVEKDPSRHPVFQVMFEIQSFGSIHKGDLLELCDINLGHKVAKFDLTMILDDSNTRVTGKLNYATSLFNRSSTENILSTYQCIVKQFANLNIISQTILEDITYLSDEDYQHIVYEWNDTGYNFTCSTTVHQLFEEQVIRTPDDIAVVYEGIRLTYQQLNQRSNQLAHYLIRRYSIQEGDLIALCMDRSEHMLIAILGILKSGAAYVPISPDYPDERISYILQDTQTKCVLTNLVYEYRLGLIIEVLAVDNIALYQHELSYKLKRTPNVKLSNSSLAYVIYTSGTTGKPKGVMVEHQSVINLVYYIIKRHKLDLYKNVWFYSSYEFDASIYEIFPSLLNGNQLFILNNSNRVNLIGLSDFIDMNKIAIAFLPSVLVPEFVRRYKGIELKVLYTGGEPLQNLKLENINYQIINEYGSTETTVCTTTYDVYDSNIIIGRRIDNVKIYLLDKNLRPVPIGAIGELYVGGISLARGYLNLPTLTQERFIKNIFQSKADEQQSINDKLYKTGDLVRYRPDANIEYIGRNDFQVKIRGFRVELGDIENALYSIKGIKQCCVIVKENTADNYVNKYLVGYYVLDNESVLDNDLSILQQWENIYDSEYRQHDVQKENVILDFSGWNSFITGKSIPIKEMECWRQDTLNKIKALHPGAVLEIGVGSGLLMYGLLDSVNIYVGLDISNEVIKRHQYYLQHMNYSVSLYHLTADQVDKVSNEILFDCIIINSVCQYFPSINYFAEVLNKSLNKLSENGSLFIGDIRNYNLHADLIKEKLTYESIAYTEDQINQLREKENELLISPEYFFNLNKYYPNLKIRILEKSGEYSNELSKYRYDVILTFDKSITTDNQLIIADNKLTYNVPFLNKLNQNQILAELKKQLPSHMLPSILICTDKLPLTINGKLDRHALPDPELSKNNIYVAARNELEQSMCTIYAEVLGIVVKQVGIKDDFFRIGGNSILAIQLISKLNQSLNSDIKITDVFKYKTVEQLYALVVQTKDKFIYQEYVLKSTNSVDIYQPFELNNVQQAYYLGRFNAFELGNIATHAYSEFKFNFLDIVRLEQAINKLIERHLALRTIFIDNKQQYLSNWSYYKVKVIYCTTENELLNTRNKLSHYMYNLEQYPLFDIIVSECHMSDDNRYFILHFSCDGLLMDGNSLNIFFSELTLLYQNSGLKLPKLDITYRDYILQLTRVRNSTLFDRCKNYWLGKLNDYNFTMNLPILMKPYLVKRPRFCRISKVIAKNKWDKIILCAQRYGLSPTAILLVIYGYVLSYWSNQKQVCINLTLFNRLPLHPQINEILGDFTVLELFNYDNEINLKIKDLLTLNHINLWNDIEHNLFDGMDVQRTIRQKQELMNNQALAPIVLTSFLSGENIECKFIDKSFIEINYAITQTSQVWLDNKAYNTIDGLVAEWDYVEQLFEQNMIEHMHEHYCYLLEYLADANWETDTFPELKLPSRDLNIIERANSFVQPISEATLFSYYESFVLEHGLSNNIAVIDSMTNQSYSYVQVIDQSNLLAKYLINLISSQSQQNTGGLVGILSEKGYNQVVSTIAIMKSGHGYLPLHIEWPVGRITEILDTALVKLLLISRYQACDVDLLNYLSKKYVLLVIEDVLSELAATETYDNLSQIKLPNIVADDIAYVIFTSGSTGKPKGVTTSHRGALNTIMAVNAQYQVMAQDKILALSELSFDLSVYDIFGLLSVGGTIVFPEQTKTKEPGYWLALINKYGISIWNTVPQLAELLIDSMISSNLCITGFKVFLLSGDWVPIGLPDKIKKQCHKVKVVSLGGATEASIWSIWYEVDVIDSKWSAIPYGVAMPNQNVYVLSTNLTHSPIGVTGEIYVGGVGVAINYWQDIQRTNTSFIMHSSLGRLYRTGDLGRWDSNGFIEFLGRQDGQVKINGYRVELSEIEYKLSCIPGIAKSIVTIQQDNLQKYLVGYLLPHDALPELDQNIDEKIGWKEEFKLNKFGIRTDLNDDYKFDVVIDEAKYRLRKSYRQYLDEKVDLDIIHNICRLAKAKTDEILLAPTFINNNIVMLNQLHELLAAVGVCELKESVLPKYLYPSIGNTYAVRIYINLANFIYNETFNINNGYYYYNPLKHVLSRTDDFFAGGNSQLSIDLVVNWPSIKPLYPKNTRRLVYLEAGHMLNLLLNEARKLGLSSIIKTHEQKLDEDNTLLAQLILNVQDKTEFSNTATVNNTAITVYEKQSKLVYTSIDGNNIDLSKQNIFEQAYKFIGPVLANGKVLLTISGNESCVNLIYAGIYAQEFSDRLSIYSYGSCMLAYKSSDDVIYSIVVGKITEEQKSSVEDNPKTFPLKSYIEKYLNNVLPEYMLPYDYVILDQIPLTANGKIAYAQLPKLNVISVDTYVAPKSNLEKQLCEMYAEILNLTPDKVGIKTNFFRLGGNSLLAMQLIRLINTRLNMQMKLVELYQNPLVEQICLILNVNVEGRENRVKGTL